MSTPSPDEIEGVRRSLLSLADRVKALADELPDERWYNLADYKELLEVRASLDAVAEELQRALQRWD
jgi:hypothetical protein